jgi:uncharacterized protein
MQPNLPLDPTAIPADQIQLAFGVIRHKRVHPREHAFSYKGFYLRVPIHHLNRQQPRRWFGLNGPGLLSFQESDHGDGEQSLHQWITSLLTALFGFTVLRGFLVFSLSPLVFGFAITKLPS